MVGASFSSPRLRALPPGCWAGGQPSLTEIPAGRLGSECRRRQADLHQSWVQTAMLCCVCDLEQPTPSLCLTFFIRKVGTIPCLWQGDPEDWGLRNSDSRSGCRGDRAPRGHVGKVWPHGHQTAPGGAAATGGRPRGALKFLLSRLFGPCSSHARGDISGGGDSRAGTRHALVIRPPCNPPGQALLLLPAYT